MCSAFSLKPNSVYCLKFYYLPYLWICKQCSVLLKCINTNVPIIILDIYIYSKPKKKFKLSLTLHSPKCQLQYWSLLQKSNDSNFVFHFTFMLWICSTSLKVYRGLCLPFVFIMAYKNLFAHQHPLTDDVIGRALPFLHTPSTYEYVLGMCSLLKGSIHFWIRRCFNLATFAS